MNNVIDLKKKHREFIEKKASEEYGAVKLGEDSYLIPANVVNTKEISLAFQDNDMYKDAELVQAISKLEVSNGNYLSLSCKKILSGKKKVVEIAVIGEDCIEDVIVTSDLLYDDREMLVNLVAYLHKEKELYITFYLHYNYELVEGLFNV